MTLKHACVNTAVTCTGSSGIKLKLKLLIIVSIHIYVWISSLFSIDAFSQQSMFARKLSRVERLGPRSLSPASHHTTLGMYLEGAAAAPAAAATVPGTKEMATPSLPTTTTTTTTTSRTLIKDTAKLGTLTVPQVGIGTISWSSDSRKCSYSTTRMTKGQQ